METFLQFLCVVGLLCAIVASICWICSRVIKGWHEWINEPAYPELTEEEEYFGICVER